MALAVGDASTLVAAENQHSKQAWHAQNSIGLLGSCQASAQRMRETQEMLLKIRMVVWINCANWREQERGKRSAGKLHLMCRSHWRGTTLLARNQLTSPEWQTALLQLLPRTGTTQQKAIKHSKWLLAVVLLHVLLLSERCLEMVEARARVLEALRSCRAKEETLETAVSAGLHAWTACEHLLQTL
jgi:hypothetical protein